MSLLQTVFFKELVLILLFCYLLFLLEAGELWVDEAFLSSSSSKSSSTKSITVARLSCDL